jgi:hypothetical protein
MKKIILIILIISFYAFAECSVYLRNVIYLSGDGYRKMNEAFADSIRKNVTQWSRYEMDDGICQEVNKFMKFNQKDSTYRSKFYGFIFDGEKTFFIHDFLFLTDEKRKFVLYIDSISSLRKTLFLIDAFSDNYNYKHTSQPFIPKKKKE